MATASTETPLEAEPREAQKLTWSASATGNLFHVLVRSSPFFVSCSSSRRSVPGVSGVLAPRLEALPRLRVSLPHPVLPGISGAPELLS